MFVKENGALQVKTIIIFILVISCCVIKIETLRLVQEPAAIEDSLYRKRAVLIINEFLRCEVKDESKVAIEKYRVDPPLAASKESAIKGFELVAAELDKKKGTLAFLTNEKDIIPFLTSSEIGKVKKCNSLDECLQLLGE
jgi:hypothetical protein